MRVMLTGATGFVGRHLLTFAPDINWQAVTRSPDSSLPVVTFVAQPDWSIEQWRLAMQNTDVVVHCAGIAHGSAPQAEFDSTNIELTITLAKAAIQASVKRFVFISSLKAMGEKTSECPFKAGDVERPEDAYGRSKLAAERGLQKITANSALELVIIRPPLVYGPGVKANFRLLQKMAALPLPLPFAKVNNRRDMVAVENLCSLIVCCLTHPAAAGQTLLVSDGEAYSLAGILRAMRQVYGRRPGLVPVPPSWLRFLLHLLGRGAMAERLLGNLEVDISETQRLLDWQPVTNLEQTLVKMLEAENHCE